MNTRSIKSRALSLLVAVAFVAPMFPAVSPSVALADTPVSLGTLTVTSAGKTFSIPSASLIDSASVVQTGAVEAWVNGIGASVDKTMSNATLKLNAKKTRLDFKAAVTGYSLNRPVARDQIIAELRSRVPTGTLSTLPLTTTQTNPAITKFGKTILVSERLRKIFLYDNNKVIKTYRCAIGQRAYPTPTGTFHIGKKVKNPTWTNGYAPWSKNMPAFIGAGPNNPLGTRAMYVYTGTSGGHDTGVRFHGVPASENSSIGHAASHGCLRMHRKDVENFFPRVTVGTLVYIIK
ncbi:MAG: L,D-transpeptidase [Coriobacteriia bacterium]|nr:L,D-transpeptidase [Coriobacteriia bacterium]